jgi:hypothetical protein
LLNELQLIVHKQVDTKSIVCVQKILLHMLLSVPQSEMFHRSHLVLGIFRETFT